MITINIRYKGTDGSARKFAEEMMSSGTVQRIREEPGNLRYEYYLSYDDPETVLLIDAWRDQEALQEHHDSPMMQEIFRHREKYDLHMTVDRFTDAEENKDDEKYIRR